MSRTLHIAITEPGGCCHSGGRYGGGYGPGGLGDPGDGPKTAQLEDPGDGPKTALLEDPGDGPKTAQLEDPGDGPKTANLEDPGAWPGSYSGGHGHGGGCGCGCGCGSPQWHSVPLGCGEGAAEQTAQQASAAALGPLEYSGFIILRLAHGLVKVGSADQLWRLAFDENLPGLQAALRTDNLESEGDAGAGQTTVGVQQEEPEGALFSRPLIDLAISPTCTLALSASRTSVQALEKKAATSDFPPLHSLNSYWRVDARHLPERAEQLVSRFNALPEVDLAYRELAATDPGAKSPATSSYADTQGYLDLAPVGIAATWALGKIDLPSSKSQQQRLLDLERGWIYEHRELKDKVDAVPLVGENRHGQLGYEGHHGTAVLGQVRANGLDLKSLLDKHGKVVTASHYKGKDHADEDYPLAYTDGHVAEAIFAALHVGYGRGDVLLLEVQRGRLATEVDFADLEAIRLASAHGLTVVEAAGNRGVSLDAYVDEQGARRLDRASGNFVDSGAIVVGAAEPELPHNRAAFSNYGNRIDCYGWGRTVLSCGYGDFDAGSSANINEFYTNTFNGTSSASPIIAGAAFLLLCLYQQRGCPGAADDVWLSPLRVRALLSDPETGTPQGPGVHGRIGEMPDLRAIVEGRLALVASPYMRRWIGDEDCDSGHAPVSCSPDIVVAPTNTNSSDWGPQGPVRTENFVAPGGDVTSAQAYDLFVRLHNRGLAKSGSINAQLYAAESATLLTPELWQPIEPALSIISVNPGDAMAVAGPAIWQPADFQPQDGRPQPDRFAFMAIFAEGAEPPPPPPKAPYFDWATFLRFQRAPHVACRNVHWLNITGVDPIRLDFLVTGAPDRTRTFDFEIIRRLPPEAKGRLWAPKPLICRMHQRRPWIHKDYVEVQGRTSLHLPSERRLAFRRVQVPGQARYCATFEISDPGTIQTGQSLAIRQLYHGREVGRITWIFE